MFLLQSNSLTRTAWWTYAVALSLYHFSEFLCTAAYRPNRLTFSSFLLDQSPQYVYAVACGWIEYWVEDYLGVSTPSYAVFLFGATLVVCGQYFRIFAMIDCSSNFTHKIRTAHEPDHILVTKGVYSRLRHPSYFGWFYWSIGTQIMLCNPISTILYAWAAWTFFRYRIPEEEAYLREFFGNDYVEYSKRTFVGIPFIPS